mgnify:CR=1 FL=1
MMNEREYLLVCVMEECSEIQKAASKALRFNLNKSEEIENEFKFYDLPERENFVDTSLLFTAYGNRRQVYLTNKTVKNILKANVIGENRNTGLNVFYAGAKVLQKESKTMSCVKHKGNSNIT